MRGRSITTLWALGFSACLGHVLPAAEPEPARPTPAQVRRWLEELNHDDFPTREAAAQGLIQAGPASINALAQGVLNENPEISWRCGDVLQQMALAGDDATLERVVHVLQEMAKRGKPGLAEVALQLRDRQKAFRHERAVAELRKLGGKVSGLNDDALEPEAGLELDIGLGDGIAIGEEELAAEPLGDEEGHILTVLQLGGWEVGVPEFIPLRHWLGHDQADDALPAAGDDFHVDDHSRQSLAERLAVGVVPGRVGESLRRAIGNTGQEAAVALETLAAPLVRWDESSIEEDLLGAEHAADFQLPPLWEDDAIFHQIVQHQIWAEVLFPGEEMLVDAVEDAVADDEFGGVVGDPPLFIAGIMPADDHMPAGLMWLDSEWRGGDAGLNHLQDLHGVSTLQIMQAELTDDALPRIAKMPSLRHLQVRGVKFSRAALRAFHRDKPQVNVMALGEGIMGVNGAHGEEHCLLHTVAPNSAADEAGLKAGDIVLEIGDDKIRDFSDLTISVSTAAPGDRLRVLYQRDDQERETFLTLKRRSPEQ
jgi:hypothetical protein